MEHDNGCVGHQKSESGHLVRIAQLKYMQFYEVQIARKKRENFEVGELQCIISPICDTLLQQMTSHFFRHDVSYKMVNK